MEERNYYGSLCTEMYEILHEHAPEDELAFYLSYARRGQKILEPLCGSGRFLVPFLERGFDISGVDLSGEMLAKLRAKAPGAHVVQADLRTYQPGETFDYIFISSGSMSLFTDLQDCKKVLRTMRQLLKPGGIFVFAVEGTAARCPDDGDYQVTAAVRTEEGLDLVLRTRHRYEEASRIQFSPGIYELYRDGELLRRETMDFQTRLYEVGEMDACLREAGFSEIAVYDSFAKTAAGGRPAENLLYACG